MAYFEKRKSGRWLVQIKKKGFPTINKNFLDIKTARKFARDVELMIDIIQKLILLILNKEKPLKI